MILIKKHQTSYCKKILSFAISNHVRYSDISSSDKNIIKESLMQEQGHICAYCMSRIEDVENVKLEHFIPQSKVPGKALDYNNMLAVCNGNEGQPYEKQTCDSHKGDNIIKADPTDPYVISTIYYSKSGKIYSTDGDINSHLNNFLNLNCEDSYLVRSRKNAIETIQRQIYECDRKGHSVKSLLKRLDKYYRSQADYKNPYIGIILWYIETKIKQNS